MAVIIENAYPQQTLFVKKVGIGLYALNLLAMVFPTLTLVSIVTAYIFRSDASPYYESHYRYLIRSFWIMLAYGCLATVLSFVLIGALMFPVIYFWWLIRNIIGLKALMQDRPIANPGTWTV
jgi:uncharacterized membrane protein